MNLKTLENILSDKGSKYAVSGCSVQTKQDALGAVKQLKRGKKYAKATHNTWAVVLPDGTGLKNDNGESGAGMVILRMLERAEVRGHMVIVTRWYGGMKLGGDRFRHAQTGLNTYLSDVLAQS